ncbi:unnamed protein product [Acanthoscelides obtectus]|uniref:Peptidase S1 domain-containing protein n=1 Tax=Acanthoscelides obtectus TaxID=200917 RepID=A0A9P0NTK9_ACAOB|nr:unnamed protein product [Acanthoscelides obtectus]CAK1661354.1 Kallikrein-7 [Acanthoscelides obtectus]
MWEIFQLLFISIIIPQLGYAYSSEESPASKTVGQATIGKAVSPDEFPYQVSLHTSFNGDEFFCGGIAVSNSTVLTPGQCLYYDWGGQMPHLVVIVHTGISSLNDKPLSKYEVSEITYHPKFNKMQIGNNLALLKISTQSQSDNSSIVLDYVLLAESFSQSSNSTENCTIVGWNKETRDLRSMDVNIVSCNSSSSNAMCIQKVDAESAMCNVRLDTVTLRRLVLKLRSC